ncbi:NACHT domain-containing protein [Streptomyces sp. NPDC008150]|uniref:NACHT domain-containing protein n=1 Tax=Streptomyces sp. NPDC008150 TaxID=3364816 RepID=UPI0036ECAED0
MEPALLGGKLTSALIGPLVRKLFRADGPGAGLVDRPVRLAALVSFRGEKRTLTDRDVHRLAAKLVTRAADSPGEPPFPADETTAVTDALAARLLALGDLDMDDAQAVRLGHRELASRLARSAPTPAHLAVDSAYFLDSATEWACLHILEFFTRRSTFLARTLVEQSRTQAQLIARIDELISRVPRPDVGDTAFERRYRDYVTARHKHITIYGIDLRDSPDRWPLEVAYLSLEATAQSRPADPSWTMTGGIPSEPGTTQLPAEDVLTGGPRRVLLRGDAGSGKTTLVQWLAVTAARDGDLVPYVLPLRTLVRAPALPAPGAFLDAVGCPHAPPAGWAERVLTTGRGLVLVDGLDEVPAADRRRARDWLTALVAAFPDNRWLLTSRPTAVRADWLADEGFGETTLSPMRRAEVATFVRRWHAAAGAAEFEERLLDSLRTKRDLARLATNPLMCGLICALHRERRGYLPTGRKELYDAALAMLLTRRDRERGMGAVDGVELGEEAQVEILQRIAYALVLSGRTEMDLGTAEGIVERCLPSIVSAGRQGDARTILDTLLLRSGLLRQPAHGVIDFVHRTFQDHLGARYAVEEGHLDVLVSRADDTQWEDVIRMAVAHARPRERASLIRRLLDLDTPRTTLQALACLEQAATVDSGVRREVEERAAGLIPPATTREAWELAKAGPLVLELLPGPEALTDEEAHAVTVSASLLAEAEPDAALAVLRRFRGHPSLDVRRQLVGTWHRFDAGPYLSEVLSRVSREELVLDVETEAQLAALTAGPAWPLLHLGGPLDLREIARSPEHRREVSRLDIIGNALLTDVGWLSGFTALRSLYISDCPNVTDLSVLPRLSLDSLGYCGGSPPRELPEMGGLKVLHLETHLPAEGAAAVLPRRAPLKLLSLRQSNGTGLSLTGIAAWQTLCHLALRNPPRTPEDWRELALLPLLVCLSLYGNPATSVAGLPVLPHVQHLDLNFCADQEVLTRYAERLPGLTSIALMNGAPAGAEKQQHVTALLSALFPRLVRIDIS